MMRRIGWAAVVVTLGLSLSACSSGGKPQTAAPAPAAAPARTLSLVLDGAKDREPELQAIAGYLNQIGVNAQVRTWEYNTLVDEAKAGHRDAYATDWGSSTFSPFDLAIPKLKSGDRGNFSHYSNPELDKLFDAASSTTDQNQAQQDYQKAQQILFRDAPWIFGYYRDAIEASSVKVHGYQPSTDSRINLHKVSYDGGDTLVVALRADRILSLDPANYRDRDTETVLRNMFDGLVTRSVDGQVKPELATSWDTPDATTYIWHLRRDVKFHNGDPMTADDVVFSFNRILAKDGMNGKQSPRAGLLGPLAKVEKVDDYTVKMTLNSPSPAFLQLMVHTQIIPKGYYEKVGFDGFGKAPVGTGPFKFVSAKLDSEVVMERFDGYWGGQVPLKKAVFRMMPEAATRIAALKTGEVQIITEIPPDSVEDLKKDANIAVQVAKGTRLYEVELNNQKFTDPKVRQALNYAVNWDEILTQLYKGYAHRVATAFLPSGFGWDANLVPYSYDPAKAKSLLQAAGYATK